MPDSPPPPNLAHLRQDYRAGGLLESEAASDPIVQFSLWFEQARQGGVVEPNAMTVATVGEDGTPSARTLLLKGFSTEGFDFFTNHESRKGRELAAHPHAAMLFFWKELERQVSLRGRIEKLPSDLAEVYFHSRPRASQIGAWVSLQSRTIPNREWLEERERHFEKEFGDGEIPLPPFWGGYRLVPETIEFWQGRPSRLHDRLEYRCRDGGSGIWECVRLSP